MKVRIELTDSIAEDEVLIRCGRVDETIQKIQQFVLDQSGTKPNIVFYKEGQEFYFPLEDILFFETEGEQVYAHTATDAYRIKYRLYELETLLTRQFVRAAKSTIVNIAKIYSVNRSITASSLVQFADTHKQVYVSRHYYGALKQRLNERPRSGTPVFAGEKHLGLRPKRSIK